MNVIYVHQIARWLLYSRYLRMFQTAAHGNNEVDGMQCLTRRHSMFDKTPSSDDCLKKSHDTVPYYHYQGVTLKTEEDGRMFPITDDSQTIINALENAASQVEVQIRTNVRVESVGEHPRLYLCMYLLTHCVRVRVCLVRVVWCSLVHVIACM
jgi:hypothetical protein